MVALALPAWAEWDTVTDRGILEDIELHGAAIEFNTQASMVDLGLIRQHTSNLNAMHNNLAGVYNESLVRQNQLDAILTALSGSTGPEQVEVVNLDEITVFIDGIEGLLETLYGQSHEGQEQHSVGKTSYLTWHQLLTNTNPRLAAIEALLQQIQVQTYGSGGGAITPPGAPDPGVQPNPAVPTFQTVAPRPMPDWYYQDPEIPDFEPGDDLQVDGLEWTPPTRSGKTNWTFNVPTGQLSSVFGITGQDITFTTDLSWYGGTIRNAVHGAILALVGLWGGLFIFEEFRRYA